MSRKIAVLVTFVFILTSVLQFNVYAALSNDKQQSIITYNDYNVNYKDSFVELQDIKIAASAAELLKSAHIGNYGDKNNVALLKNAGDTVKFNVVVPTDGYYEICLSYTGMTEVAKSLRLNLMIDDSIPFDDASTIELKRCYVNETPDFKLDDFGNDIRPAQVQQVYWQTESLYENNVGTVNPYIFYFSAGNHGISITAENGGLAISELVLKSPNEIKTYKEYIKDYSNDLNSTAGNIIIDAEKAQRKSDTSLHPQTDRTNCATTPFKEGVTKLNSIGGANWCNPSQWIEWDFQIKTAGFYKIDLRVRQNTNQGMKSYRTIKIDNEIPFSELKSYGFVYNRSWYVERLSDEKTNEAYLFYFEPGLHTLKLEVTTGDMYEPLERVKELITNLNDLYHSIIMITGTSPDIYRDYNLEKAIPGLVGTMNELADSLDQQLENIKKLSLGNATAAVSITTLSDQLRLLAKYPKTISDRISNFYSNISAVSAWANSAFEQPLEIDTIVIGTEEETSLKESAGFFKSIASAAKSFLYSFTSDYNTIGGSDKDADVKVWTLTGRDQAEALSQLIERDFVPKNDINVSLKLVQGGLIEAVAAGTGPDVVLSVGINQPVDFASRNILEPLEKYDGFDEVRNRFYESAFIPFEYKDSTYALPETQEFYVMFYRTDILNQLGMSVPNTWTELTELLPILARNNMQIGIPCLTSTSAGVVNTAFPRTIITLMLQNEVDLYTDDLRSTNLNHSNAVKVFEQLTDFYNKYGLPTYFDASNRFRTGEMPIIISTLSTYNMLSISAPEIDGRWKMSLIPGTEKDDGTIDYSSEFSSTACVMFKSAKNKEACWKFMSWWTYEQAQYDYGMELEALLGVSGRYITANKAAFERLPWDSNTADIIREQWKWAKTVPQVPGYYCVSRYLTNAITDCVNNNENARVSIGRYTDTINSELKRKNNQLDKLVERERK